MIKISSAKNEKIKDLIKFRNKNGKLSENQILIEGSRELERALAANIKFIEIYFCTDLIHSDQKELLADATSNSKHLYQVDKHIFEKIAFKNNPFGIIVIAEFIPAKLEDISITDNSFILVAESIEKPGNLGALMRTADGAGIDTIILANKITDYRNPNVIRASTGTIFSKKIIEATSADVIEFLKNNNIEIIVADPYADKMYYDVDYSKKVAVVVGSEAFGLSDEFKDQADTLVKIPMKGFADSLNVNQAATIVLYEAVRQRK
ncbi:MAG: RNA methyltransferase [Candidatus Delongbacteria bacterium]|jgi:TrmH family RNA methyltransferase|nr:RNA methyltransferase [Candidatus Delongbacteria bacterium]